MRKAPATVTVHVQPPEPHTPWPGHIGDRPAELAIEPPARTARAKLLTAVLVAGAFAVVLAGLHSQLFDLERHAVPKELALHATALVSIALLAPAWRRIELGVVEALLAAFVAWSALSAALAVNPWLALRGFGVTFSAFVLYLAARQVAKHGLGRVALAGLASAAALGGLFGVAQAYGAEWTWLSDSRPPGGTFGNRNFLAHLMAIALPGLLLVAVRERRMRAVLGFLALLIAGAAIILTRSRGAWLGSTAALGVMAVAALMARRAAHGTVRKRRLVVATLALAGAAGTAIVMPNRLAWRTESPYAETFARIASYREGSGRGRLIQYRNSLALLPADPLFGVGPGNWYVHYPRVTTRGDPSFSAGDPMPTNPWPSSDWVALVTERGTVALLLVLLAGGAAALTAARRLLGTDPDAALRAVALLGMLAAVAITGAFDAVLLLPAPSFFVACMAGLLLGDTRPVITRELRRASRWGVIILASAVATVLVLTSLGHLLAIRIASAADTRAAYEHALRFYPGDHRLRLLLARRGPCSARVQHARVAAGLLPHHDAPRSALAACGTRVRD